MNGTYICDTWFAPEEPVQASSTTYKDGTYEGEGSGIGFGYGGEAIPVTIVVEGGKSPNASLATTTRRPPWAAAPSSTWHSVSSRRTASKALTRSAARRSLPTASSTPSARRSSRPSSYLKAFSLPPLLPLPAIRFPGGGGSYSSNWPMPM